MNGLKRTAEFSVIGVSKAFFQVSREEDISFIAGLDDAETFVAGLRKTQPGASSHFCFVDKRVKILLQTIDNGMSVKTFLSIGGVRKKLALFA
uniref:hypothetical protein n=1 Tax=Bartonella heixiaziensis TaxID=1461000 RepID=UPI0039088989